MENDLQWKRTFTGRRPSVEDDLWWKTTFRGRWPLVEDDLWWKTTFSGRRPSVENDLWCKKTFIGSLHAAYSALRHFFLLSNNAPKDYIFALFLSNNWFLFLMKVWNNFMENLSLTQFKFLAGWFNFRQDIEIFFFGSIQVILNREGFLWVTLKNFIKHISKPPPPTQY